MSSRLTKKSEVPMVKDIFLKCINVREPVQKTLRNPYRDEESRIAHETTFDDHSNLKP